MLAMLELQYEEIKYCRKFRLSIYRHQSRTKMVGGNTLSSCPSVCQFVCLYRQSSVLLFSTKQPECNEQSTTIMLSYLVYKEMNSRPSAFGAEKL